MTTTRYTSYVICTSPRSGSTLLCKLLSATGNSGCPDSHFHQPSIAAWAKTFGFSERKFTSPIEKLSAIFEAAKQRGAGTTGVFGLRLQRGSFEYFMAQARILHPDSATDKQCFEAAFGRTLFIHLTRHNKLEQAISLVKAQQSGLWHKSTDGTELERVSPPGPLRYDAEAIARNCAELQALDDAWAAWFQAQRIEPLRLTYEALSRDPSAVLATTLRTLGVDQDVGRDIVPPVAKLADATNRDWADRLLKERPRNAGP